MTEDDLYTLTNHIRRTRRNLDQQAGEARAIATTGKRLQAEIADLREKVQLHEMASGVLSKIGEDRQAAAQAQIEALVTQGLRTIFGEDLSFHLIQGTRNKAPVVDFVVRSTFAGTTVETEVMDARGGGLAATVGFLLRLVVLLLSKDKNDTVLFLDETFAHVSAEYETRLAEFLRQIVDKTGVQIIMVTHSDAFSDLADTRYRFELVDGVTKAKAV